jgi:signal transduction histidine kinase
MPRKDGVLVTGFLTLSALLWTLAWLAGASSWGDWFDNGHWTLATGGAVVLALRGWAAADKGSPERVFRFWFALALGFYFLGQLAFDVQTLIGWTGFPAPSDPLYLALSPLILWAFHSARLANAGSNDPRNPWTDTLLLTLGWASLVLAVYLPIQGQSSPLAFAVLVLYPVFFLAVTSHAVLTFLFSYRGFHWVRFVFVVALLGSTGAWMEWNYLSLLGKPANGSLTNLLFSVSILALGWAAARCEWSRTPYEEVPAWTLNIPLWDLAASVGGLVALLAAGQLPGQRWLFYTMAGASLVLALVRQRVLSKRLSEVTDLRERSRELERALHELRQTQDQLIQSEKLAAVGPLIAGIAHDLNSPLGAIRSATTQIRGILEDHWPHFMELWEALDPELRAWTRAVMAASPAEPEYTDGRRERAYRKELTSQAADAGRDDANRWAEAVAEAGLFEQPAVVEQLLVRRDPYPVLELLTLYRQIRQLVSIAVHASDRASGVVKALQHFLHTGPAGPSVYFDAAETVRRILPLFEHRVRHGIVLEVDLEEGLFVQGWPDKLTQVWVNLITNALQALGNEGRIQVKAYRQFAAIVVSVEDDGRGIPVELQRKVFDPFFTTKAPGEGTGLGLDVCRRVVEEAGGTITLDSRPGRTVFEVTLPEAS